MRYLEDFFAGFSVLAERAVRKSRHLAGTVPAPRDSPQTNGPRVSAINPVDDPAGVDGPETQMLNDDGDDGTGFKWDMLRIGACPAEIELAPLIECGHGARKDAGAVTEDRVGFVDAESCRVGLHRQANGLIGQR